MHTLGRLIMIAATLFTVSTLGIRDGRGDEIHTDFSAGMQRNGSASSSSGALRPSGYQNTGSAYWWKEVRVVDGFTTEFPFYIGQSGSADGNYDSGFAFVVQDEGSSALGGGGSRLGYDGITSSLAVEFDHRSHPPSPFAHNHLAVQGGGTGPTTSNHSEALQFVSAIPDLRGNHVARIVYTPGNLQVWLDPGTYGDPWVDVPINLGTQLDLADGKAFVGFTGASGNGYSRITHWDLVTAIPEPSTLVLGGMAAVVLLACARRRWAAVGLKSPESCKPV